jgi:nucleoside-diphosphate-sugar epimerase
MRVFVAGAGGALGSQLVRHLVADRHEVIGFTRSAAHAQVVQQLGASRSITGDALDPSSIRPALESTRPDAVVHAFTAIPKRGRGALRIWSKRTNCGSEEQSISLMRPLQLEHGGWLSSP